MVLLRSRVLRFSLLAFGLAGACSTPGPGTQADSSSTGTGGTTGGSGGSGSGGSTTTGTGGTTTTGSGGSTTTGSGGSTTTGSGGATGSGGGAGGVTGSGGASGSGGAKTDGGTSPDVRTRPAVLSYAKDIAPIIQANCSPCHTTEAKAGYNWTYQNLVTDSAVTSDVTAISPCGKPLQPGGANLNAGLGSNAKCNFPDTTKGTARKRVLPGVDWEWSLLWLKIAIQSAELCTHMCGGEMPPTSSGKVLGTFDRDTIKIWMQKGALP